MKLNSYAPPTSPPQPPVEHLHQSAAREVPHEMANRGCANKLLPRAFSARGRGRPPLALQGARWAHKSWRATRTATQYLFMGSMPAAEASPFRFLYLELLVPSVRVYVVFNLV
jgi:hypothetical protein